MAGFGGEFVVWQMCRITVKILSMQVFCKLFCSLLISVVKMNKNAGLVQKQRKTKNWNRKCHFILPMLKNASFGGVKCPNYSHHRVLHCPQPHNNVQNLLEGTEWDIINN